MSVARKSLVFVGLTFGISWIPLFPAWRDAFAGLGPLFFLFGPVIAAIVCTLLFERGRRCEALGLSFRLNSWWLIALLLPLALGLVAAGANILIGGQDLLSAQSWRGAVAALGNIAQARYLPSFWLVLPACILLALLTEEPGWRGYLYYLWRDFGFWRFSVAVGLLWAVWHWPMLALGYNPDMSAGPWDLLQFTGITVIFAVYATLIRDRAGSIIAVGVFHGAWNSVSGPGVGGEYVVIALLLVGLFFIAFRQREHRRVEHARSPQGIATSPTLPAN